jgi:hypothetical protein
MEAPLGFCSHHRNGAIEHKILSQRDTQRPAPSPELPADSTQERRRLGRIVHDERGTASVQWIDAPADEQRVHLAVEDTASTQRGQKVRLDLEKPGTRSFDPYGASDSQPHDRNSHTRRDLRKLSEWIKLRREVEDRKRRGDDADDE